jgi:uncharacterized repeat protein (TIGR01451 family)
MAIFTNQATLTYGTQTTSSNVVTGEIVQTLSVTKTALQNGYRAGDVVTYVIGLVNSGTVPFTGLTLQDDLGAYPFGTPTPTTTLVPLTYVDGSLHAFLDGVPQEPAPTVTVGTELTFTDVDVPAGSDLVLVYQATLGDTAPLGSDGQVTNTVTVTGAGLVEPLTAQATITAADTPYLTINKAITPGTVVENGQLTYTFTIQNYGSTEAVAGDNVTLTDQFNPILDPIAVTYGGQGWTEGTQYTYNRATGAFATVPGQITVPAATYSQDPVTGVWTTIPGVSVLTVTGTV